MTENKNTATLAVYVPAPLKRRLKMLALQRDTTVSEIVRRLVEKELTDAAK